MVKLLISLNSIGHLELNIPKICSKCKSPDLKYKGVGEYHCSQCQTVMYDDYGLVRKYIEENPGATQVEVSLATGVSKGIIRRLLREDRIEITPDSPTFLHCEKCGADIRSGIYCAECTKLISAGQFANSKKTTIKSGISRPDKGSDGARRFNR